jgi:hypothetical protein
MSRFSHFGTAACSSQAPRFPTNFHAFFFAETMKASLFSIIAAATFLAATPSFAAASANGPYDNHRNDHDRDDRNSKDFNYGFDKKHRVTPQERARWEAAHRDNRNDDRRDDRHDQFDRNQNYGFDRDHRVTPQERARWESAHRNDGHR